MATLDFSDAGALDVVTTAATSELANLAGLESADLTTELADVKSAVTVIAGQIAAVTDFEDLRNDADGVLAAANYLSTAGDLDLLDATKFNNTKADAVSNTAPSDIDISDIVFSSAVGNDGSFHQYYVHLIRN